MICELAEGNLDDFISKHQGPIPEDKIMSLFVQILLGLNFIHRNKIDHRDLKTLNILLYDNGERAKLADFGFARNINSMSTKLSNLGTFIFMAPEAQKRRPVPFKSDMYSLGIILHLMLTKKLPDYIDNIRSGIFNVSTDHYSTNIVDILARLLKKKPEERPSVKELLQDDYVLMTIEKL